MGALKLPCSGVEEVIKRRLAEIREREKLYRILCLEIPRDVYEKLVLIAQREGVSKERLAAEILRTHVNSYYGEIAGHG
jgi:hypothetical protein